MKETSKRWVPYFFLMLLSPLLSLYFGVRDKGLTMKAKKWLLIIFITIFGSVLHIKKGGPDAYRHQESVNEHYVNLSASEFSAELYDIITFRAPEGTTGDVYLHVLGYFVGSILQMPSLLFVFVGFIYAIFYIGAVFRLLNILKGYKLTLIVLNFLFALIVWKTVQDMQTIRTYTGLWVMFYGGLSYFETGRVKYLGLLALPPLIHLGYFIMVIPVWIVVIFRNRKLIYSIIFIVSFFTQIVPEQWALQQLRKFPLGVNKIHSYYLGQERMQEEEAANNQSSQNRRFYRSYQNSQIHHLGFYIPAFALLIFGGYFFNMAFLESSLFSTGILAKALSNGTFFLFALSARLNAVAGVFILSAIVILFSKGYNFNHKGKFKRRLEKVSLWTGWVLLAPYFIYKLAEFVNFGSFFLLLFPFIPWFTEINFSIKTFILEII